MAVANAEKILTSNYTEGRMQLVASSEAAGKPAPRPIPVQAPSGVHPKAVVDSTEQKPNPARDGRKKKETSALLENA